MKAKKVFQAINEVAEANVKPYDYNMKYSEELKTYIAKFETDQGIQYDVHLKPLINYLDVDFGTIEDDPYQFNKGDVYRVMATITTIIEDVLNRHEELVGFRYDPHPVGGITFDKGDRGEKRDKLFRLFISKRFPYAEIFKNKNSPTRFIKFK